jgi:hypothetical protein
MVVERSRLIVIFNCRARYSRAAGELIDYQQAASLNSYGKIFVIVAVMLATIVLRTFMPVLPE